LERLKIGGGLARKLPSSERGDGEISDSDRDKEKDLHSRKGTFYGGSEKRNEGHKMPIEGGGKKGGVGECRKRLAEEARSGNVLGGGGSGPERETFQGRGAKKRKKGRSQVLQWFLHLGRAGDQSPHNLKKGGDGA